MNNLFISDLHVGSPLFDEHSMVEKIKCGDYDRIFLVGDIFDVWQDDFDDILRNNENIVNAIREVSELKPIIYIVGNHDPSSEEIKKKFPSVQVCDFFELDGGIVVHGHMFDVFATKYSWIARFYFVFHWIFERLGINLQIFRDFFYSVSNKRDKDYYKNMVGDIENNAVKEYKSKYKFVVMGHTHWPKISEKDGFTYANSGDWIHNKTFMVGSNGRFTLSG